MAINTFDIESVAFEIFWIFFNRRLEVKIFGCQEGVGSEAFFILLVFTVFIAHRHFSHFKLGGFMSQEPFVIIKYPGTGDDSVVLVFTEIFNLFYSVGFSIYINGTVVFPFLIHFFVIHFTEADHKVFSSVKLNRIRKKKPVEPSVFLFNLFRHHIPVALLQGDHFIDRLFQAGDPVVQDIDFFTIFF